MIHLARSDADIARCFSVMQQLRPQVAEAGFIARVRQQMQQDYQLAILESDGDVAAVAGFRISENLAWGRYLSVEDLVTDSARRSHGTGKALLAWLREFAREKNCQQLHLDSGVQRAAAHRFYRREGMRLSSHHFMLAIDANRC